MPDNDDDLGFYLHELYKNLNIVTQQLDANFDGEATSYEDLDDKELKAIERQFDEWMGSFYNILVYLFCTTIAFLAAVINSGVRLIPITMFSFFPIYLWFTFFYSIFEVRINDRVIFSRKDLTIKKQIELGKSLFNFFLRQLYDNSKHGIAIMLGFLVFLAIVVINEYIML